jgi:hypothetical protein
LKFLINAFVVLCCVAEPSGLWIEFFVRILAGVYYLPLIDLDLIKQECGREHVLALFFDLLANNRKRIESMIGIWRKRSKRLDYSFHSLSSFNRHGIKLFPRELLYKRLLKLYKGSLENSSLGESTPEESSLGISSLAVKWDVSFEACELRGRGSPAKF